MTLGGLPARLVERRAEGQPVAGDEAAVAVLVVDLHAGVERRVGHPAAAAGHRGRQPAAARAVPGGGEPGRPGVEQRVDHRRVPRVLDGAAAVALDEGQHHVLAAQPGQQLVGRGGAERVVGRLRGEHALVAQARGHLAGLLVGERGRAAGGDRHGGDELRAEGEAGHPGHRQDGDGPGRGGPVPADDPGDPQHGQRRRDDHDDDQHDGGDRRTDRARRSRTSPRGTPGRCRAGPSRTPGRRGARARTGSPCRAP